MGRIAFLLAGAALILAASTSAQIVEGVDVEKARERTKTQLKDVEAFSREIARRGEALKQEATQAAAGAQVNRARLGTVKTPAKSAGKLDFDALIASADQVAKGNVGQGPRFIAFASTSMPPTALQQMMRDVPRAGGVVVFRGFKHNSVRAFSAALAPMLKKGQLLEGVGIDPRLFRSFGVRMVPAYVVVSTDFDPCDGFDCVGHVPPFDIISGNVTAEYALKIFADGGGPGAAVAKLYLQRLQKGRGR